MMPVSAESSGPSHFKMRQPGSHVTPEGTLASTQTMESSSGVRETETNWPFADHSGTAALASRRLTAYRSGKTVSVRSALRLIATYPFFYLRRIVVRQHIQQPVRIPFLQYE